jgi:hypothetical protein
MERNTPLAKRNPESGTAVFLSLFALAAVGYACLRLITQASGYTQILRIYENGLEHQNSLRASVSLPASPQRRCDIQKLSGGTCAPPDNPDFSRTTKPSQHRSPPTMPQYYRVQLRARPRGLQYLAPHSTHPLRRLHVTYLRVLKLALRLLKTSP